MRREELYLRDIVEAVEAIDQFLRDVNRDHFLGNELIRSAVLQKLMVIGEAASRLPADFTQQHTEIPWRDIVAFRNIAVHAYFSVDWNIVWVAATKEAPELRDQVAAILRDEFSDRRHNDD